MLTARPILVLGPTAGGKSEFAVELAERLSAGGEVIGADSMQVYRHLDAGTAKPSAELRRRVPHHLIDVVEPTERFTVHDWLHRAEACIAEVRSRGRHPIVVGGTNLYLKALLEGMFDGPARDPALRRQLGAMPLQELHDRLGRVDPEAAERIHPNDRKRLVRALEVYELTGTPISRWQAQWQDAPGGSIQADGGPRYRHDPLMIGLRWPTELINRRINARVKAMFEPPGSSDEAGRQDTAARPESLPEEVRRLEAAGKLGPQAREALGYRQVLEHLADPGRVTLDDALEQTKIQTRRFAKQQRTWMKHYVGVRWLEAAGRSAAELADEAVAWVETEAPQTAGRESAAEDRGRA